MFFLWYNQHFFSYSARFPSQLTFQLKTKSMIFGKSFETLYKVIRVYKTHGQSRYSNL